MKKIFKKSMIALMVVLFSATLAMASGSNYRGGNDCADCSWTECGECPDYCYK